jgi:glycosyltransferase involved in cell wall biosynthesis
MRVVTPVGSIGWKGGDNYVLSLNQVLKELDTLGSITLIEHASVAKKINKFKFIFSRRGCEIIAYQIYGHLGINLPWPIVSRKKFPIFWIPDVQDLDHPENFDVEDLIDRNKQRLKVITLQGFFYFSSKVMESRFLAEYPSAKSLGIIRFTSNLEIANHDGNDLESHCSCFKTNEYIYAPNQWWIHKNHKNLIAGYNLYRQNGGKKHLVLTGPQVDSRRPELEGEILELIRSAPHEIHNFGVTSREIQSELFVNCGYVAQVSFYEGWSTIVEESLKQQKHLLLSDIPVHREQLNGENAVSFCEANDPVAIAEGFERMDRYSLTIQCDYRLRQERFRDDVFSVLLRYQKSVSFFRRITFR